MSSHYIFFFVSFILCFVHWFGQGEHGADGDDNGEGNNNKDKGGRKKGNRKKKS